MPPIYLSTGKYSFTLLVSNGLPNLLSKNLMLYHDAYINMKKHIKLGLIGNIRYIYYHWYYDIWNLYG